MVYQVVCKDKLTNNLPFSTGPNDNIARCIGAFHTHGKRSIRVDLHQADVAAPFWQELQFLVGQRLNGAGEGSVRLAKFPDTVYELGGAVLIANGSREKRTHTFATLNLID